MPRPSSASTLMDNFRSHQAQLIATALAASAATAGLIASYNAYTRRAKRKDLNDEVLRSIQSNGSNCNIQKLQLSNSEDGLSFPSQSLESSENMYNEELIREQLARNYAFFGEEGMKKVRGGAVVVVGCGGVGSWAAVMLARSCVAEIILNSSVILSDQNVFKVECQKFASLTLTM